MLDRLARSLVVLVGLGLPGCADLFHPDSDGDGLTNQEEADLGTNPDKADTDGDGLSDGEEVNSGTDPLSQDTDDDGLIDGDEVSIGSDPLDPDTDADTYLDAWEVDVGTDPTDPDSRIYQGYWPYNPDKDSLEDPGFSGHAYYQEPVPRLQYEDQYGDTVDLYDFAGHDRPVLMDLSAVWCSWCKQMAMWLEGKDPAYFKQAFGSEAWYDVIPLAVADGKLYWITVLSESNSGGAPSSSDVQNWAERYDNDKIPVLLDASQEFERWVNPYGLPTVLLVGDDMTIEKFSRQDYTKPLEAAYEWLQDNEPDWMAENGFE